MKKYLLALICIVAVLTSGCVSRTEKKLEGIAKNLAVVSLAKNPFKVDEYSKQLEKQGAELRYIQIAAVDKNSVPIFKKYKLNIKNKKKCAVVVYRYDFETKHVGYCK